MKSITRSYKSKKFLFICITILFQFQSSLIAQNVSVSGASSGNGSYTDLKSAFSAINAGTQTGATISVNILANTTETASAVLNAGAWNNLSIIPSGGGSRTVSGNIAGPLVDLNGADKVYIDGLNASGNSLTFSNVHTGNLTTSTIRLMSDATSNTITNCSILGSSTSSLLGTVVFTLAGSVGNINNIISSCSIGSAGSNPPANCIFSIGNSGFMNSNNSILNCSIYDYFHMSEHSTGITLSGFNESWKLDGNRFYQTAVRNYTIYQSNYQTAVRVTSGNSYTLSNNIIGYSSASSTGTYVLNTSTSNIQNCKFIGIDLTLGTSSVTTVQANTITAFSMGGDNSEFSAIKFAGGNLNISSNVIGGTSGLDLIKGWGWPDVSLKGIYGLATTGAATIQNNYLGGFNAKGFYSGNGAGIIGIHTSLGAGAITGNTVGSTTSDNMQAGTLSSNDRSKVYGILYQNFVSSSGTITVAGNLVQNIIAFGADGYNFSGGIAITAYNGGQSYSVTNNLVRNLKLDGSIRGAVGTAQLDLGVFGIRTETGNSTVVNNNTVTSLAITGASGIGCNAVGIQLTNNAGNGKLFNNRIFNITNGQGSTGLTTPAVVSGIQVTHGTGTVSVYNNFISLGSGNTDNTSYIGIYTNPYYTSSCPQNDIFHNTINIEGVVSSGGNPTFGYYRGSFGIRTPVMPVYFKNNIVTNSRSGGSGAHFAISNDYGASTTGTVGWNPGNSDYNVLNATYSVAVGNWGGNLTFASWKSTSGGDGNSYNAIPVTYVNSANDLHINMGTTPNYIESRGTTISTVPVDIDGQSRPGPSGSVNGGALGPDIGADEIDGVPIDNSPPAISYTTLASICSSGDRTLTAGISDLFGVPVTGTLQPRIYFKKNAGAYVSSQGTLMSGTTYSGTWSFTISNSALGGVADGDIISYFIIAEDVVSVPNIGSSPSVGLVASNVNSVTTPPTITTQTFVVKLVPIISVNSGTVCSGSSFTILPSGATTYSVTGGSFTVNPLTTTSYSVTGTGTNGCQGATAAISNVTVLASPVISVNSPSVCSGNSVVIVPSGASTYSITGNSFTVGPLATTIYSVTGTNSFGCVSVNTAVATVIVHNNPIIAVGNYSICPGQSVMIVPTGAATYTIQGGSFAVSPSFSSSYTLTGTSAAGCPASNTVVTTVFVSTVPIVSVNSGTVCSGNPFIVIPSGASTYTITGNSFTVSPSITTSYSVTGSSGGCVSSNTAISTVSVLALPTVTAVSGSPTVCAGAQVMLSAGGASAYVWSDSQTGADIAITPTANVNYTVTGTDANGCSNTAVVSQYVDPCTDINNASIASISLSIYPNPNNGAFIIEAGIGCDVVILNSITEVIYTKKTNNSTTYVSFQGLASGIYFVSVTKDGNRQTMKMVVE
jgi:hypothetical protein